jgi:DNA-binding NarL/FixJ family response regulator
MQKPSLSVAVVDDSLMMRESAKFQLTLLGHQVVMEAENGQEFLDMLSSFYAAPDVCLLDINMPVMDGLETTKHLKKKWPSIKILFYSMEDSNLYGTQCIKFGADGFVPKTVNPGELNRALLRVVNQEPVV